jgi:hypothetical protein
MTTDDLDSLFTSWTLAIESRQRIEATARAMDWAAERSALNGASGGTTAIDIGLDTALNFALVTENEAAFNFRAAVRACKGFV